MIISLAVRLAIACHLVRQLSKAWLGYCVTVGGGVYKESIFRYITSKMTLNIILMSKLFVSSYDAEISQADYEYVKVFNAYGADLNEFPGAILARLTIFFKEAQFITSKRSELYGLTDFMANVGGLLGKNRKYLQKYFILKFLLLKGLFMGVSILSLIEILYYITLRLACHLNYRRQKKIKARRVSSNPPVLSPNVDFIPGIKVEKYNGGSKND